MKTHSNIISAKFFAGSQRVISGHIHIDGKIDYSNRVRSGGEASQSSGSVRLEWRTNEQTRLAEWWDGTKWVEATWFDEHQKWYAYYNGDWVAW